ncbi:unnamed protein product [Cyprideis torosa]|uniref:RING-type E3 ubiquitin transferase n=1 Tax=Cyprideis torosa TaxID=163714 RepID=A0A7R8WIE5_9CRUS|nr:unnamed protein product [Cyprideis torosa]CAG0894617.1 unnamed protein product [Cyprideis torosa]
MSSTSSPDEVSTSHQEPESNQNYFCHECSRVVNVVQPEFVCSNCRSGFVEEVLEADSNESDTNETQRAFEALLGEVMRGMLMGGASSSRGGGQSGGFRSRPRGTARRDAHMDLPTLDHLDMLSQFLGAATAAQQGGSRSGGNAPLIFTTGGGIPIGAQGIDQLRLDDIVTQFLNQLDPGSGGAPPLSDAEISQIPESTVTEQHVADNAQCAVCMDDFKANETVRKLSCDHFFHPNCIVPWVRMHGTCPVCRQRLQRGDNPNAGAAPAGGDPGPGAAQGQNPAIFGLGPFQFIIDGLAITADGAPRNPSGAGSNQGASDGRQNQGPNS